MQGHGRRGGDGDQANARRVFFSQKPPKTPFFANQGGLLMSQKSLDFKQTEALTLLLAGKTIAEAAAKVAIGERTLQRWLAEDEAFRDAYQTACAEAQETAFSRLRLVADRAVATLEKNLGASRAADQNRAAAALLHHLERIQDRMDVTARLKRVEEKLAELKRRQGLGVVG